MAERFSQLSDIEKRKKSYNLSKFLAKKMSKDKKDNFNKFTLKLLEMEYSLERRLPKDRLQLLLSNCGGIPPKPLINLSTSLVEDHSHNNG
ncbi:unnamed protein product [Arabis nemorensis]|uniref:Uncharacterized protein n=1 Tax=Arabis nemorensis TaxID=586526 RepID=A0A565CND3_9BRAS|nr:unnamed protein product [Arabis nemorensis]